MKNKLPARPNLDHLRRQAKALLANLAAGKPHAISTFQQHLPAATGMTAEQVQQSHFRLADAQSAIARQSGFGSWPALSRHVEQLRALEGTWSFARLQIDGAEFPAAALGGAPLLIDGDRFRTESPEATYEGIFNINVEAEPHEIDIEFVEGPEAGNWNYGIFRVAGDRLELCLDLHGKPRPTEFVTTPASGHACETLQRISTARPTEVTGGTAAPPKAPLPKEDPAGFDFVESPTLLKLQGEWSATRIVRDGLELPKMMLSTAIRSAKRNEIKISFGGQTMIHALVRIDQGTDPIHVDYYNLDGMFKGTIQLGILKWAGEEACFCMAAPGQARPSDFTCEPKSERTLSQWRRKK